MGGEREVQQEFYNNAAEIGAIIAGAASACYAGKKLLDASVNTESWASSSIRIGAIFDSWSDGDTASGVPLIQIAMFLINSFWMIASMS